ncbi:Ig-like domain repeat protein, partial [Methanobrevibacter sp.]|uniref:Ig-like domain repeat protein n=1 Tax=Methanobrevibacter sp. TaxID=66852 RepID=UPI00386F12FF
MAENTNDVDLNQTTDSMSVDLTQDYSNQNLLKSPSEDSAVGETSDEIVVENWEDLQYYSSLNDKNYVLKLKENTNYYPMDPSDSSNQILFNNNVTIIGASGAYIGDTSPNPGNITYTAMLVPDNNGVGITVRNVLFKWIGTRYSPDGVFLQMGGNSINYFENCYFTNISTNLGHSSILHIKTGDAIVTNCTFINCTTDFGCLSVYNPKDDPTGTCVLARMNVTDSYFEGNYARTEPGCINNCGILVVNNSTFYKNSAFWWAGAIHTHGGANTTIYDSDFIDNLAGWNGGALYTYSYLQIYNTNFIGNNCTTNNGGGAIGACKYLHAPYITIRDSLFKDNQNLCWGLDELSTTGTGRGGAISIMDQGLLDVRNTTFIKNSASMGTAICAINGGLQMGTPDVIIVGNRFINHTRVGDVLDVRVATSSYVEIRDNYYLNNSFEFKKLRLLADEKVGDNVVIHIDAELKNPNSFETDILDTTPYDIYVDGAYNMTVIGRSFSLKLKDGETCHVYAAPCISNSVSNEILVGVPKEYVYVSQNSGNDANNGSTRASPVKTMTKAVELARTKGNIVIMDGTFNEANLTVDYNLTIAGENNVKFSGNIALEIKNIFTVTNKSDLRLSGITFDNIVMIASNTYKNKRIIEQTSGYLTIENCTFNQISPSGNTAMVLIEAPNVEVYNSKFTNNNKASVYVTLIKSDEFLIDNCTFTNNIASYSSADSLIRTANTKSGKKGTVTDSIFENNKVKGGCVYFGASSNPNKPITITNTKFISNSVGGTSDHASCIKIEESATLNVDQCLFVNNINLGTRAAVIYAAGGYASIFVSSSIILNNSFANNNHVVFSASTANNLKVYKNLNGNWWGNTLENIDAAPAVYQSACDNWIVLNMTANATKLAYDQNALVSIDLYNAIDREGNSSFVDASKLPDFDLDVVANNGVASTQKINVINGMASLEYTLKSYDSGSLTVKYDDVQSTIDFVWSLVNPDIEIDVENNTYGNPVVINITVPGDVDASKFSLKIHGDDYNFNKSLTIPKLNAGEYLINLTYSGDAKYNLYSITKLFKIEKATPQLTIDAADVYYPNSASIAVNAGDATGQISIKVGDKTDSKAISSGRAEFIIANLQANDYTVEATYSGDANYRSGNASANFKVKKHNSTITISNSNIVVNQDVTLTFNVNSDASGTVTVDINGNKENVTISGGKATYIIRSISRGLYDIVATYNGDAKYLSSQNTTQLDVARLTPDLNVAVSSVTYGQDAEFTVTLNDDASGSVTVIVDGKNTTSNVNNGKASLNLSDLTAGNNKQALIKYSGDNNYKPKETTKTFNIAKAMSDITINAVDIKEGQVLNVQIIITRGTTGTIELNTPSGTENPQIPRTGLFTRIFEDLGIGQYTISANYGGDTNFLSASASKSFTVSAWGTPQWPNQGYDVKNTEKSPYSSEANGNVKWVKDIDGTIIGNMAIDSEGRIYVVATDGIYSINPNDGSTNWIFNSQDAGNNFSGIAIGRDTVLVPKSGDKLYFINQTTGEQYHNNIYQGSSVFAPIVDENANIYISGEYYGGNPSTNVVVVPYKIWQTSTAPVSIEIGNYSITSSPVLVDDNTIIVTTENSLMGIDLSSKSIIFNNPVVSDSNPVVGLGNMVYIISNGQVISYDVTGKMAYNISITGSAGNYLSFGVNGEIFSINREGKLFEYSTGEEALIYDFKEPISSRLLVGQGDMLFVGSDSGMFYAIDVEGNLLWKENLNQSVSASPVMDSNGVIYTISGNRIVAIDKSQPKDPKLTADIKNVTYGEDVIVNVDLDKKATGIISVKIGNAYSNESVVSDGKVSFIVSDLPGGIHTAEISYSGDYRFKPKTIAPKFSVGKIDSSMDVDFRHIKAGEVLQINITNLPNDATGTVSVTVGGKSNSTNVMGSNAKLYIHGLSKGEYPVVVTYSGDVNYNGKTVNRTVSVGYEQTSFNAVTNNISVGQDVEIRITGLPSDANGVAYVNYNNLKYSDAVTKGSANITIPGLAYGTYDFDVEYANDTKYSADSQRVHVVVSKITPEFTVSLNNFSVGDDLVVDVSGLPSDATGLIIASIAGLSGNVSVANGAAKITIPQRLADGSYQVNVTYSGNNKYNEIIQTKTVKISKITPKMVVDVDNEIKVGDDLIVDVSGLPSDAKGHVNVEINGISNSSDVENGIASVIVQQRLANGNYTVTITYSGDDRYNSLKESKSVKISKISRDMVVVVDNEINVGEDLIIEVSGLPTDTSVRFVDIVGDLTGRGLINQGSSRIVISNLTSGKYSFIVLFNGDDKYNRIQSYENISVNKLSAEMKVIADNIDVGENLTIQIELPSNISGEFAYISINDTLIKIMINNGKVVCSISGLTKGTYPYTVSYGGNDRYEADEYSNKVEVGKIAIDYDVTVKNITYTESAVVSISNLPADASGNVTVVINKNEYSSKVSGSTISISIPGLNAGQQTAEVRYSDEKYMANSKYVSFNVKKADPKIDISANDIKVGEDLEIRINLPKDATRSVIVNVGEISKTVNLIDGAANVTVSGLSAGIQTIEVSYSGDTNYNSNSNSESVTVSKVDPTISVEADDIKYGENLIVRVSLPTDATGNVVVKVGGKSQTVEIIRGNAVANISGLTTGKKSVNAEYNGDDKYNSISGSKSVTVNKLTPNMIISAENINYGESLNVKVQLSDKINGNIIISDGKISKTVKAINGVASAELVGLAVGSPIITAEFEGNSIYNPVNSSKTITVSKIIPKMNISANDIKFGETLAVRVNLPSDATGVVLISVGEISKTIIIKNGVASCEISNLTGGVQPITAKYDGDNNYYSNFESTQINVSRIDTPIIILADDIEHGENLEVSVKLDNRATGNVIISIDDITQSVKIINGSATTTISSLTSGVKTINAKYDGDANFNSVMSSKNITVTESSPSIVAPLDVKIINDSSADISIPNATGTVSVIVDGKLTVAMLDKDGNAHVDFNDLAPGKHSVIVVYDGDDTYKPAHKISSLNVPGQLPAVPIASKFCDFIIGDDLTVTMTLKDEIGNVIDNVPVRFEVNKVLGNTKTNAKGILTIAGKAGELMSVMYDGSEKFLATNITLRLNNPVVPSVVKVSTHFNISGGVVTVKGYAVDTKAGEEGIYFTTQLLDVNGKPVKGVPIQFAVN